MTDLVKLLRDEDSYYRLQEKHWCIDSEELERQRLAAADLIEAQAREIERLREAVAGLMKIAEMAMPDTYFATDSRVNAARAALGDNHDQ